MSVNNAEMHEIIWKLGLSSVGEICITPLFPLICIAALESNSSESLRNEYLGTLKMAVLGRRSQGEMADTAQAERQLTSTLQNAIAGGLGRRSS